jgi:hypothetical protein
MAKSVIYKKAKEWVWESLSKNENQSGIELFDNLIPLIIPNELFDHPIDLSPEKKGKTDIRTN